MRRAHKHGIQCESIGFPMGVSRAPLITFPQASLRSRKVGFPDSGSDLGTTPRSSSRKERGLSADPYAPQLNPVYFQRCSLVCRPSVLMGRDDSATLVGLGAHRRELIDPGIAEYGDRSVKTTGDGLLLEFSSVVNAVRCAVDLQPLMAERNAGGPPRSRSNYVSASTSATSSSMRATSLATASMSPRGCRRWPSLEGSA